MLLQLEATPAANGSSRTINYKNDVVFEFAFIPQKYPYPVLYLQVHIILGRDFTMVVVFKHLVSYLGEFQTLGVWLSLGLDLSVLTILILDESQFNLQLKFDNFRRF